VRETHTNTQDVLREKKKKRGLKERKKRGGKKEN